MVENASKLCLLRRRRRALTTGGASAALFRDASISRTGLAQNAKDLTLVRLGLLAAALCWCFVAVPLLLPAGVMVMETLPVLRPDLLLGRRLRRPLPKEARGRTCIEIPTSQQRAREIGQKTQLGIHLGRRTKGELTNVCLRICTTHPEDFWHHACRCYSGPVHGSGEVGSDGRNGAVPACCVRVDMRAGATRQIVGP